MDDIHKLANKLCLLIAFSKPDNVSFYNVVRDSIDYSMSDAPQNLLFLDVLDSYVHRASLQEVRQMYVF